MKIEAVYSESEKASVIGYRLLLTPKQAGEIHGMTESSPATEFRAALRSLLPKWSGYGEHSVAKIELVMSVPTPPRLRGYTLFLEPNEKDIVTACVGYGLPRDIADRVNRPESAVSPEIFRLYTDLGGTPR